MKVALFFAIAVFGVANTAPVENKERVDTPEALSLGVPRRKRSHYGPAPTAYISPCAAAAASAPIPSYAPAAYQLNLTPVSNGYGYHSLHQHSSPQYGYGSKHFRAEDFTPEEEMMLFSDMNQAMSEQMPMSRYAYESPASHIGVPVQAGSSPAIGVFPSAGSNGCQVPLLLTCSPSIVRGTLGHLQPQYAYAAPVESPAHSYREVDDSLLQIPEQAEEQASNVQETSAHRHQHEDARKSSETQ